MRWLFCSKRDHDLIFDHINCLTLEDLRIGITLAITWPQGVLGEENSHAVAAQVNGDVRHSDYL